MSTRNLTSNSPQVGHSSDENDSRNPFNQEEESYDGDSSGSQIDSAGTTPNIGKPYIDYSSYQHSTTSSVSSPNRPMTRGSSSNALAPPEYDRYPSLGNSRVASMNSIASRSNLLPPKTLGQKQYDQSMMSDASSGSEKSTNPFLVDADFSPFGGYPASSFPLHIEDKEPDDYLHNPDPVQDAYDHKHRFFLDFKNMDKRSIGGLVGFFTLIIGLLLIFILLPALTYTGALDHARPTTYSILTDYVYPQLSAIRTNLVDEDTPEEFHTHTSKDGDEWQLVFSDEFNQVGRTFYEGDEQFWYAPDFHYAATQDLEWYDPDAVTTENGTLVLRMDAIRNHNLFYRSGMLHSWNRMCFTQGFIEVSARLPNFGNVSGLWPGMWTLGNLGRPGYMATTDGVWPYTYDACDAGITPNQSSPDGISYLGGQRLSSCTCPGDDHPNAGTGRGAPEIDILEGEVDTNVKVGVASQSYQIAPMDIWYHPDHNFIEIYNDTITSLNTYTGGPFQQAVSGVSTLNTRWYERGEEGEFGEFQNFGYEYMNGDDDGYIRWFVGGDPTVTLHSWALAPNGNIGWRRISKEPMSIVLNLGISNNWAYIDWNSIQFPTTMEIDYVRVYQPRDSISLTCDPVDYPTFDYIEDHPEAYQNVNRTNWESCGYTAPKNRLVHGC